MMKGEFIDVGILSQSCNLYQEIMFFMPKRILPHRKEKEK